MYYHPLKPLLPTLPTLPGSYIFMDSNRKVIYVGKAKNLRKRVSSYFQNYEKLTSRIQLMIDNACFLETYVVDTEVEALILEASLIKKYKPKYNVLLKDDKSYSWIKITKDPYPIVYRTRNTSDKNAYYFGPFPNSRIRDKVLSFLRKYFPFRTCSYSITDEELNLRKQMREEGKDVRSRLCIYYHIGKCGGPCEGLISRKEYLANISSIKKFLTNKKKTLILELEQRMKEYSDNLEFEKAAKIKEQIDELIYISNNFSISYGDDEDDVLNLYYQKTMKGLEFLIKDLKISGYEIFLRNASGKLNKTATEIKELRSEFLEKFRIECFDISNLCGTDAVGSMVVFEGGFPLKSHYRKFKVKTKNTPDDFQMMREVLMRRFFYLQKGPSTDLEQDNSFYRKPDLVIIDGGKGQLGVAVDVLKDYGLEDIFVCSLAKKREELFIPGLKSSRTYYHKKDTLFLLQRIRDEAHRFGISYHRDKRSESMFGN